jgi:hypothetical protein
VTPDPREPAPGGRASGRPTTAERSVGDPLAFLFESAQDTGEMPRVATDGGDPAGAVDAPPAPPEPRRGHPRLRRLLAATLLLGAWAYASVAMLVRPDGVPTWRSLWAEDGSRFLPRAIEAPGPGSWLDPYAGYLHLIPRALGDLVARFPLVDASIGFAVASSVVAGGALLLFAVGLRRWLPAAWMQAALVAAVATTHAMASEIAANAANLHWYLTLGLIGLALLRPRRVWTALPLAVVAAAFALSDPFAPVAAVLALADAGRRTATHGVRGPAARRELLATWPVPLAMLGGAAAQVVTMLADPRTPAPWAELPRGDLLPLYGQHVVRDGLSPEPLAHVSGDALVLAVAAGGAVLLGLVVAAAGSRRRPGGHAVVGALLVAASPVVFVLDVWVNRTVADRYAAVPVALLVAGVLILAAGVPKVGRWVFLAAAAGAVALGAVSFATHPLRAGGPDFVADARRAADTQCVTPDSTARVGIAPLSPAGGSRWTTDLPCARIFEGPLNPPLP